MSGAMRASGGCLLGRADLVAQLVQGYGCPGRGEEGKESALFVTHVFADLELQLRHQVIELRIFCGQALQVLEVLFHLRVIGEFLVGDFVTAFYVLAHRGVQVHLLGDGVAHQLDSQFVDFAMVGCQFRDHAPAVAHQQILSTRVA